MSYQMSKKKGLRGTPSNEEADYISQSRSNPHSEPSAKKDKFYKEHGEGTHFEESEQYPDRKTVSPKGGPRTDNSSEEIEERNWQSNF